MLADYMGFFSRASLGNFGFRWLHILAGITWIGLLYYFNFVQVPAFAQFEDEPHKDAGPKARNIALVKIATRALWWFRWAALATFLTGLMILGITEGYFDKQFINGVETNWGRITGNVAISTGIMLGTIMMLNVWGVIWRNQKVVLANAANVLAGGEANPAAAAAGRKALMASRQNTIFSISMLFFMVFKSHNPMSYNALSGGELATYWTVTMLLVIVLELNALGLMPWKTTANKGLNKLYDGGVKVTLYAAFGLWVVMLILTEVLFKA
ncbi:MAG TPA: urate hydroxylase PuuD [Ilumatobacteraceae bacterium]|nr:urate hydroxylase PuuD [Ilumatobacteraceae bacterium]